MRGMQWVTWGTWAAPAAMPLWVVAGAALLMQTGAATGWRAAVVGGALLCLAGLGAGARRLEPVRVRAARDARGAG